MTISEQEIKQFLKDKGYLEIIFSPKGREIWDPRPPFGAPVQPFEELPHDNFVKITCYQGGIGSMSGSYKSFIEEIKETNTDFLVELFNWATKKENVKRIDTEQEVADAGNEIAGSIKEVIIVKKTQQDYKNDREAYAKRADQMIANRKCFYCNAHIKPEAKNCLQHLKSCSLCPEAVKDFAKDKMIELGLNDKDDNSHRERERERERESKIGVPTVPNALNGLIL